MSQFDELPEGWEAATFGDVCQVQGGFAFKSKDYQPDGVLLIRISNLVDGKVEANEKSVFLPETFFEEFSSFQLKAGDVLIAMSGATTGKMAIYDLERPSLLNQRVGRFVVVAPGSVDSGYVGKLVSNVTEQVLQKAYGGAQPNISPKELEGFPIPLPPLNEQRRIVEKIEALTVRSRKAREALEAIPNLLDQFRQSVLAAAFRGDLTADWREQNPDVEPAEVLLEKVQKDIASQYLEAVRVSHENGDKKSRKPPLLNLNIKSYSQHHCTMSSWLGVELEALAPLKGLFDGPFGSNLKTSDYVENGVRVIRLENIGFLNFIGNKSTYISHEKYKMLEKHTVFENDLLFASFASEGVRACLLPPLNESAIAKADCFCLRPYKQLIDKEFLLLQLSSPSFYKQLESLMHGATRLRVSLTQLRKAKIWLCSVEEQREIVRRVRQFFNIADFIEQEYQDSLGEFDQLDQSILAKAFRGELVPQDPNDEPANLLLERIRAERERLGNSTKRGKAKT